MPVLTTNRKDQHQLLYLQALAAPLTVKTMPAATLLALAGHAQSLPPMDSNNETGAAVLAQITAAGINLETLATQLQDDGAKAFVKSWHDLLTVLDAKCAATRLDC